MSDEKKSEKKEHEAPKGSVISSSLNLETDKIDYQALAEWIVLRKDDKPMAEMFHVAYLQKDPDNATRPITFVFNGGPGASSAYLHVGALGPKRVEFNADGTPIKPPAKLIDNKESWLAFSDLVFIDPIGTGFSRTIDKEDSNEKKDSPPKEKNKEYWQLKRDLESLGEFIQKFLSKHKRWDSPIFIAGESYGGFRVGKLARMLQEGYGIGLNGAILISPALEWVLLNPSDYEVLHWIDTFPTMALSARHHGKSRIECKSTKDLKNKAEEFASIELATFLIQGERMPQEQMDSTFEKMADFIGLTKEFVASKAARIPFWVFCRELFRESREVCGLYDTTVKAVDPFPDRENHEAPDPTLYAIERVFSGGINTQIRQNLKLESDRDYTLLSMDVNTSWKVDTQSHAFERQVGATDDLRYAFSLNPHMKVFITHGIYDLVTPYFSSNRMVEHMKLTKDQKQNLTVKHFKGGHMFYAWEESRIEFTKSMREFYASAL